MQSDENHNLESQQHGQNAAGTGSQSSAWVEQSPPKWKPHHVVVFVHGMGEALKGGTLREWAEPLLESFHDVALDSCDGMKETTPVIIDYTSVDTHNEAWVRVLKRDEEGGYLNVLLTEARWAEDFAPATPVATFGWSLLMAFRVWWRSLRLIHWNLRPWHIRQKLWGILTAILLVIVGIVSLILLITFLILLFLLVLLAWLPVVRKWVGNIVELFAKFLGDPRVWTRSPLQAAAMRQRVIATLDRSRASGANVTVVAHSQGAAIAGQVLLTGKATATNFVSLGSGLPLLGYARFGGTATGKEADPVQDWIRIAPPLRWINVWGKFDFVPAGPVGSKKDRTAKLKNLFGGGGELVPGPEEHPVYNRSALISDHVFYSANRVEVLDPLAQLIYKNESAPEEIGDDKETWLLPVGKESQNSKEANRRHLHRHMVKCLGATRLLAVFAGISAAQPALSWVQSWPLIDVIFRCESVQGNSSGRWPCSSSVPSIDPFSWPDLILLAVATASLAGLIILILNHWLWEWLHRKVEKRRDKSGKELYASRVVLAVYLFAVAAITIALPTYINVEIVDLPIPVVSSFVVFALLLILISLGKTTNIQLLKARVTREPQTPGASSPTSPKPILS